MDQSFSNAKFSGLQKITNISSTNIRIYSLSYIKNKNINIPTDNTKHVTSIKRQINISFTEIFTCKHVMTLSLIINPENNNIYIQFNVPTIVNFGFVSNMSEAEFNNYYLYPSSNHIVSKIYEMINTIDIIYIIPNIELILYNKSIASLTTMLCLLIGEKGNKTTLLFNMSIINAQISIDIFLNSKQLKIDIDTNSKMKRLVIDTRVMELYYDHQLINKIINMYRNNSQKELYIPCLESLISSFMSLL